MNDKYWLPELPPAEDRLAQADAILDRQVQDYRVGEFIRNVFWIAVTVTLLVLCVIGVLCL